MATKNAMTETRDQESNVVVRKCQPLCIASEIAPIDSHAIASMRSTNPQL